MLMWCRDQESNQGHTDFQSVALPTELSRHVGAKGRKHGAVCQEGNGERQYLVTGTPHLERPSNFRADGIRSHVPVPHTARFSTLLDRLFFLLENVGQIKEFFLQGVDIDVSFLVGHRCSLWRGGIH